MKKAGYATGIIGKWHLGIDEGYKPLIQGFDYWWGARYSNDCGAFLLYINEEIIAVELYNLMKVARIFKITESNKSAYKKVFTPFVTNCLASDMMTKQMGANSGFGAGGRFAIVTGHAYYKEIQLAGESGTAMISAEYDTDEIKNAKGFANGTSWARELKKLVRRGDVEPSLQKLYGY